MAKAKPDSKTLRWLARQAAKERHVFPMHQFEQGQNEAFERVRILCLEEARAIETAAKKGKR
jgi:hypothetical protein